MRRREAAALARAGEAAITPVVSSAAGVESAAGTSASSADASPVVSQSDAWPSADRSRRVRDAVEAALSDIILLGTDEQVRLAALAANELVTGRPTHTAELVISLRNFIRQVLDLDPVPKDPSIPKQGPTRPSGGGGKGGGGGAREDGKGGGGGGGGGGGMGGAMADDERDPHR